MAVGTQSRWTTLNPYPHEKQIVTAVDDKTITKTTQCMVNGDIVTRPRLSVLHRCRASMKYATELE